MQIKPNRNELVKKLEPIVSIGMPVYNNKETIFEAIDTILNQSFRNFELIISDNASTDGTEEICRSFAENDARITYIRQKENKGLYNFVYVYKKAKGEFFMWAPAHYSRSLDFIENSLAVLKENLNCTFSATPNCWVGEQEYSEKFSTFSFKGTVYERVSKYLDLYMQSHACFYGLFRRSALEGVEKLANYYIAFDNAFILQQLFNGEFGRSNDGLLVVGKGRSAHPDYIATWQTRPIHYILPLYDFSKNIMIMIRKSKKMSFQEKFILLIKLLTENSRIYQMIIQYWFGKIKIKIKKTGIYDFIKKN